MIVGSFGPVVFSVSADQVRTFREGSRERGAVFYVHTPIGRAPRLEPIAPELAQVRLVIELDQFLGTSPAAELLLLGELKDLQAPWPLIIGPVPMGEFVLTNIAEEWKRFTRLGALSAVRVALSFLEDTEGVWAGRVANAIGV